MRSLSERDLKTVRMGGLGAGAIVLSGGETSWCKACRTTAFGVFAPPDASAGIAILSAPRDPTTAASAIATTYVRACLLLFAR
jgi:hypothetical protein